MFISRFGTIAFICGAIMFSNAAPVSAQFHGGWSHPGFGNFNGGFSNFNFGGFTTRGFTPIPRSFFGGLPPVMPVRPVMGVNRFNPLMFNPFSPFATPATNTAILYGSLNRLYSQSSYPSYYSGSLSPTITSSYSGYMSGSTVQRDYGRAQYEASEARLYGTRSAIAGQGAYERRAPGLAEVKKTDGRPLARALAADSADIASGAALNQLLPAIIPLDKKEKIDSDFLPPNLLANIRFTGNAVADTLSLLHTTGQLEFPPPFAEGKLATVKPQIEKDFAAAAGPALAGKPIDPAKLTNLDATLKKTHVILNATIKDLDFEDATAARRFMNQLDSASIVLRKHDLAAAIVPSWATEGTSTIGLVRLMAKFKLQFGPAPKNHDESYVAMHRALSDLLFVLLERNGQGKKKP